MRKLVLPLVLCALGLGFGSCQRELLDPKDLQVVVSPGFQFPLAHVSLDMGDVLPEDTTGPATLTTTPYYTLSYHIDSLAALSVADLLQLPAQSPASLTANMGLISLPDVNAGASVSMGTLAAQVTNPSNFASSMATAHGSNALFPALPVQNPGALSTMALGSIQSADFADGTMEMQLVNGFPAAMNLTVALANTQGAELLTFTFTNVAAGDSATSTQSLANVTLPGALDVVLKNLSSPGAGTPGIPSTYVAIDTNALLDLTLSGTNLKVRSATATPQTQSVVDSTLWMNFGAPAGMEITEVALQSGQLTYSITSGFPEDIALTLGLPGSNPAGIPWAQTISIANNSTVSGSFPWSGLVMNLAQDSAQPYNQLPLAYAVTLQSSGQPVTLDSSQAISFSFTLDNLGIEHVFGFFGQDSLVLPGDTIAMSFPALDRLQGSIVFAEPSLSILSTSQTSVGLPLTVNLDLTSVHPDGSLEPLGGPMNPTLNTPVSMALLDQNQTQSLTYDKNNSNIVNMLSWPKTGVVYGGKIGWNLDTAANGRFNYIHQSSQQQIGIDFTLPFAITASGLRFTDSVDVVALGNKLQSDTSIAVSAELHIHSTSTFPIDAALHFRFYDAIGSLVWTEDLPLVHSGLVDPQTGFVTQSTSATDILTLDSVAMEQIAQAQWLEIEANLETAGGGQDPVKLEASSGLEVHVGMNVEFEKVIL